MTKQEKYRETAQKRMQLIAPLLAPGLDKASFQRMKEQISQESGLSERTLRRYLSLYHEGGFDKLKPALKAKKLSDAVPEEILQEAILLRRQVPSRSVAQIIQILEWEGIIEPGQIKRSTLQEKLSERGYSSRQMKQYRETGAASRRFQKPHRNSLWQSDLKYSLYIPIGKNGSRKQVYLATWIDDATRFVLHSEFYPSLEKWIVIDSFRQALLKHGLPKAVYFDNGTQYKTKWMKNTTGLLNIKLLYSKPYSPEAHGKVESFNKRVDSFLAEAKLEKISTLDELNHLYTAWLNECYQHQRHSALKKGITPSEAFRSDSHPIRYADPKDIHEAFLHREERRVDKTGCISLFGKPYEVGLQCLGMKVEVIFDPSDLSVIKVQAEGLPIIHAKERVIGHHVGPRPKLPEYLTKAPAQESRLLKAVVKKSQERERPMLISYRKSGEPDV